jgi:hypothetical protein
MSAALSKMMAFALAVAVAGAATNASARPKKARTQSTSTQTTMCGGTPIIMQGMECSKGSARGAEQTQPTERADLPRIRPRGSSGTTVAAPLRAPSLNPSQPSTGVYMPPPVDNPSARINQLNQSFPFNAGIGNNPTDRDSYIRYNLTR